MMLNENEISEFKSLYEAEFGADLDLVEAEQMAGELISLYELILLNSIKLTAPIYEI